MLRIPDLFVFQASNYLHPEGLLRSEAEESQRKLHMAVDTLSCFKQGFQDRREHLRTYFKENQEVQEWDFQSSLVFERLDGFLGRLIMVQVGVLVHGQAPGWTRQEARAGGGRQTVTESGNVSLGVGGSITRHDKRELGVLTGNRKEGPLIQRGSEKVGSSRGNTC